MREGYACMGSMYLDFGRCKATWKKKFNLSWREAGPPNHLDDKVDSDQALYFRCGVRCSGAAF